MQKSVETIQRTDQCSWFVKPLKWGLASLWFTGTGFSTGSWVSKPTHKGLARPKVLPKEPNVVSLCRSSIASSKHVCLWSGAACRSPEHLALSYWARTLPRAMPQTRRDNGPCWSVQCLCKYFSNISSKIFKMCCLGGITRSRMYLGTEGCRARTDKFGHLPVTSNHNSS